MNVHKWKKVVFYVVVGMFLSATFAIVLYWLSGQVLYFSIIGLGAGIGFYLGGGLDRYMLSQ